MADAPRSANVVWQQSPTSREERWAAMGGPGATVWLTGLPASGKSTLAAAVEAELLRRGRAAYVLDGDNLRHGLNGDLGFSADDRAENVRRTAEVAALLADAGVICLAALVSPTRPTGPPRAPRTSGASWPSARSMCPPRWSNASAATPRASTPGPGRVSSRA